MKQQAGKLDSVTPFQGRISIQIGVVRTVSTLNRHSLSPRRPAGAASSSCPVVLPAPILLPPGAAASSSCPSLVGEELPFRAGHLSGERRAPSWPN